MRTTIPNFAEVEPGIYRGGQPQAGDWDFLRSLGVVQVIKLNGERSALELCEARKRNIAVFFCPISAIAQVVTEPDLQTIRDAVGFIGPGTFIHCEHGQDRTGLVVGLYRRRKGWPKDKAYAEMKARGFHAELFGLGKAWEDLA